MRQLILFLAFVLAALIAGLKSAEAQSNTVVKLNGMWKFKIGDQSEWASPKYSDAQWSEIYAPSDWESKGFPGYDGYGWYRKTFTIPKTFSNHLLIVELGYIDDVDEVFLNGEKIGQTGSFPPDYSTAYNARRQYVLPGKLLKYDGDNLLSIRVYDSQLEGGIVNGEMKIFSKGLVIVPDIDLSGRWQFSKGKEFRASAVREMFVPGSWENQGLNDYDGFAVYRKQFIVEGPMAKQIMVLLTGRIDDIDEAYINGKKVGASGSFSKLNTEYYYRERRYYVLPAGTLKSGENTVEIKVYDSRGEGGIIEGPVGLITQDHFRAYWHAVRKP